MTLETWTMFFGWMTILNFRFLIATMIALTAFRPAVARIHNRLTGLDKKTSIGPISGTYPTTKCWR